MTLHCCVSLWLTCFTVSNSLNTPGVRSIKDITISITTRNIWAKGLAQLGSNSNNMISHFTQFYFGLLLFFTLWNWAIKHPMFLRSLMTCACFSEFNSMTYDNVDLQIFRQKEKPIQSFKGRQRRRLHDLCFVFQGYLSIFLTTLW